MQPLREILESLLQRHDLSESDAEALLTHLTNPDAAPALAGALLAALRSKGVIAAEMRGFARGMRRLAERPQIPFGVRAIDIVGTGGDASGSLNISTGTALLVAACGLDVVKHGNRSVSSRAGSADVLEALGLVLPLDSVAAGECLAGSKFTFLFSPHYHPAMKALAPVRAALGVRTIFNILGPLVNPAEPPLHLIGAFSVQAAQLIADTLAGLEIELGQRFTEGARAASSTWKASRAGSTSLSARRKRTTAWCRSPPWFAPAKTKSTARESPIPKSWPTAFLPARRTFSSTRD